MELGCPACPARYHFPTEILVTDEISVRCPSCGSGFALYRDVRAPAPARPDPAPSESATPGAAIRPRRAKAPQVLATIRPTRRAADEPSLPPGDASASAMAGYLLTRDGATTGSTSRRKVVVVHRSPGATSAQARIVSLPANFGRKAHTPAPLPTPEPRPVREPAAPPETPDATAGDDEAARWRPKRTLPLLAVAAGVMLAVGVGGVTLWLTRAAPEFGVLPEDDLAVAEVGDAGADAAAPTNPRTGGLRASLVAIEPVPDRNAALLTGELVNGTPVPQRTVRVEATLLVDGTPVRRRTVWCCTPLDLDEAVSAANNPRHPHYALAAQVPPGLAAEPGQVRPFGILFPGLNQDLLSGDLQARFKLETPP